MDARLVNIREANGKDWEFVKELMCEALEPFYGGDHETHAKRIFSTHISGGKDNLGYFSFEQKMFIIEADKELAGMIHLVGKRQGTYKISPIIVAPKYTKYGLGKKLLDFAENYAKGKGARQIYCTVSEQNEPALQFFIKNGYIIAGKSDSHYKAGIIEVMLYKLLSSAFWDELERENLSVLPFEKRYASQVRDLLLKTLPGHFEGINGEWVDSLFAGYERRHLDDIFLKYKLIYITLDRNNNVKGVIAATPKKSRRPIKLMPFIAQDLASFIALLIDIPYLLKAYGRKLYIHIVPDVGQTIFLQRYGWKLDAVMPAGYHPDAVTQQWSFELTEDYVRPLRSKQFYLDLIRREEKTLEVRVGYEHIKTIRPGDRIRFFSLREAVDTIVKDVRKYSNLVDMMKKEDHQRIIPGYPKNKVLEKLQEIYPPSFEKLGVFVLEI